MPALMTFRMAQHLKAHRPIAPLAEIEHPDGTARFWTGIGKLAWRGSTWTGSGTLGSVTPLKQTTDVSVQEIVFQMAGVDRDVAASLSTSVRNKIGSVWLAGIWQRGVVADPLPLAIAQLDYQQTDADDQNNTYVSIYARAGFYNLDRNIDTAWTTQEQQKLYPTDTGFDLIPGLQNQDIIWSPT